MGPSPIPNTAPFAAEEIEILNRVVSVATPLQRAWLAGFLAGLDAAGSPVEQPAARPQAAEPLTILFASESGNCERLANDMAKAAPKRGFKPTVEDMADLEPATLAKVKKLVVIAATWGEGDPPARAVHAYEALMGEGAPRLDGMEFGVLALGDTAYVDFCAIGQRIDERLAALGAKRAVERVDCDLDFEKPAANWIEGALSVLAPPEASGEPQGGSVIAVDFGGRAQAELGPVECEVVDHINLNSSRSGKQTIHLALGFDGQPVPYEPGDALDLFAENNPSAVEAVLKATGIAASETFASELRTARDIQTLSAKTFETFVATTGHKAAKALLDSGQAKAWIVDRHLVDLLEDFPVALTEDQLRDLTRPLAPRAYSIASSRRAVGDEAHLLIAAVRYETHGRAREGVASAFVADRVRKGATLRAKLRANKHFRLPAPDADMIMVGPGTGIAPFRAFVQERQEVGATGRNWLFYGDRHYRDDFLYQLEWQDALKDGVLTRMDLAFSRDKPEKVYVQDRIWARRRDLVDWLDGGARFYVCGDAKAMAKDVRATLVKCYADVKALAPDAAEAAVRSLESGRRYLQDVY